MTLRFKQFATFLLIFSLTGCAVRVAYGLLDWLILWKLEQFVQLQGEQKKQAKEALNEFHIWHRETQLPQYSAYLAQFKTRLNSAAEFSSAEIHQETDELQVLLDQSLNYLKPHIVSTLNSLDEKQSAELLANIDKNNEKYRKKYVLISSTKQYKKRIQEFEDNIQPWMGRFTNEQEQWVASWAQNLKPYETLTAKQQEQWRQQFETMLNHRKDFNKLEAQLGELMFYRTDNWEKEIRETYDFNQTLTYELLARILNHLSEKQKKKFNKKLDNYIEDLGILHNKLSDDDVPKPEQLDLSLRSTIRGFDLNNPAIPFATRSPYLARASE